MTQITDLTRRAGEQRWRYAGPFDRKVAGDRLRPYRLTKQEACKRLVKARAVKAQMHLESQAFKLNLSSRPKLR
jgi:hypothetical protein